MKIAGLILVGGSGTRMGAEKALVQFRAGTLLDAVVARASAQVGCLALSLRAEKIETYRACHPSMTLLPDIPGKGAGPLAGLLAGLEWIHLERHYDWLATFPCDTPFLPLNLVEKLARAAVPGRPVVASADGRVHNLCAIWPASSLSVASAAIESGAWRSMHQALHALHAIHQLFDDGRAFFNINTPEDLAEAERRAQVDG